MGGLVVIAGIDDRIKIMKKLPVSAALLAVLLFPTLLRAEVWRCPQPNGSDLFTNLPPDSSTCEKYVSSTELIPFPTPTSPPSPQSYSQQAPAIPMPYARDGPTQPEYPEYDAPYYPDSSYSYPYYSYYGPGFFAFRRPHARFAPGVTHSRGRSFGSSHFSTGRSSHGGGRSSGHR